METKQTAVEWLTEQLVDSLELYTSQWEKVDKIIRQAKEMEKRQIVDANINGSIITSKGWGCKISKLRIKELAEQYYNETFNK